jgi:hypothetical protein
MNSFANNKDIIHWYFQIHLIHLQIVLSKWFSARVIFSRARARARARDLVRQRMGVWALLSTHKWSFRFLYAHEELSEPAWRVHCRDDGSVPKRRNVRMILAGHELKRWGIILLLGLSIILESPHGERITHVLGC